MIVKKLNSLEKLLYSCPVPRATFLQIFYILGDKKLSVNWLKYVNFTSTWSLEFGKISNFGQLTPRQLHPRQSRAKINETFHIFGHFKVRRPPPCPHDQCWKKWVEFSLFSHSHNIEMGVRGTFMRLSQ
jgi:hypothetical protein